MNTKIMKTDRYNPISAAFTYAMGNMLIKAVPFLTLPLFTRILSTVDYGLYNAYLSYESIITILFGFGLTGSIRVAKVEFEEKFDDFISSIFGLQIVLAAIFDIAVFLTFILISPDTWMSSQLFAVLLVHCICSQVYNIGSAKYAICGEVKSNLIMSIIVTLINVGSSLFLCIYVFPEKTYWGRILGTFVGTFVVAGIILIRQSHKSRKWIEMNYWKYALHLGLPLILHSLSLTLLYQCDKIMIQALVGDSETGIYSIAVTISGIVTVLVTSIDNAWAPWFYFNLKSKEYSKVKQFNDYIILAFFCIILFIMLMSPEIIKLFSAKDYWDSIYAIQPLLVSIFFNLVYLIPVNFEYFHKKTGYIAYSSVITAGINIGLNLFLIFYFGYIGAAYATCLSKLILLLMHLHRAKKIENIDLLTSFKLVLISIIVCLFIPLTLCLINFLIVRIIIIIILIIRGIVIVKKNDMFNVLKDILSSK